MSRRSITIVRGEDRYSYSSGEVVEALQGAGVLTDAALAITRQVEDRIRASQRTEIPLDELMQLLGSLVKERVNAKIAERLARQTPPFVPLRIVKPDGEEKLSLRKITRSLEGLGLSLKQSSATARQVLLILRTQGFEQVPRTMLTHLVAATLEASYGRAMRVRYERTLNRPVELRVLDPSGAFMPFSRGVMARSMMAVGVGPALAYSLATRAEDQLWTEGRDEVTRQELRDATRKLLEDEAGAEYARRYMGLHRLRSLDSPVVILIGGAAGVGKSTIAAELAYRLGIARVVSTDSVREAIRSLISKELSPVLHASSFTAWQADLLPGEEPSHPRRKQVIRGFVSQVKQLMPALNGIIDRNLEEASQQVLEGIHLVPGYSMRAEQYPESIVVPIMLTVSDEESHRDHFAVREKRTASRRMQETYMRHFREVRILQDFLEQQARAEAVRIIDASDYEEAVEQCLNFTLETMFAAQGRDGA